MNEPRIWIPASFNVLTALFYLISKSSGHLRKRFIRGSWKEVQSKIFDYSQTKVNLDLGACRKRIKERFYVLFLFFHSGDSFGG